MRTTFIRTSATWYWLSLAIALTLFAVAWMVSMGGEFKMGYGIVETGLYRIYPRGYSCSRLTSLYASMIDVDGSRRDRPHSGVDGGSLGDAIFAPADGTVKATWLANWGWGEEGALIIRHSRKDLNLRTGPPIIIQDSITFDTAMSFISKKRISGSNGDRKSGRSTPGRKTGIPARSSLGSVRGDRRQCDRMEGRRIWNASLEEREIEDIRPGGSRSAEQPGPGLSR